MSGDSGVKKRGPRVIGFLFENSIFLIAGAFGALVWANVDFDSYHHLAHNHTFHFIVNLMR